MIGSIPYLMGFHPADSVVALSLRGDRAQVGLCLRVDLPPPEGASDLPAEVVGHLVRDGAGAAVLVVYESDDAASGPGRADVLEECAAALDAAGVTLRDALYVAGGRWWSYLCAGTCCPPAGTALGDPGVSPLAAATVLAGGAVLPDRESAVRALDPPAGPAAERVGEAVHALAGVPLEHDRPDGDGLRLFAEAVDGHADPRTRLDDTGVARLAVAARTTTVRDEVSLWATGPRGAQLRRLLTDVLQRLPAPEDADVATMLALVAYQQGDGMVARTALDRALASDPENRLARMVETALDAGIPPSALAEARTRARLDAHRGGEGAPSWVRDRG